MNKVCEEYIFIDGSQNIRFKGRLTAIPLEEDSIIRLSIEFFNDESPCFIHRSAVMKKMFIELERYFKEGASAEKSCWRISELPEKLQNYLRKDYRNYSILYRRL